MKTITLKLLPALPAVWIASTLTGLAQESEGWGRVSLSYRAGFNISASFSGLGGFTPTSNPGSAGRITGAPGAVVRTYDDGFIGIDVSGNAGNSTTYWGYNDQASQWIGDTIQMHSSSSAADVRSGKTDGDPQHGAELSAIFALGSSARWSWGLEAAANWTDISIQDSRPLSGSVATLTHAYSLGGVIPPVTPPPYTGSVAGPGPLLSDVAVDVSGAAAAGGASVTGTRTLSGSVYGMRLGPALDYDISDRWSVGVGGGFALGFIDNEFSFFETVTIPGLGSQSHNGRGSDTDWLYGGYVRGQINFRLCKFASVFGAAEFNHLGAFDQTVGGKSAHLDLGRAVYASAGLSFWF